MDVIQTGNFSPTSFSSPNAQPKNQGLQAQVGSLLGQNVLLIDEDVSLADSAEELSLHMHEKAENHKHHSERRVKAEKQLQPLPPEEIDEFVDQLQDPEAQEKLNELTQRLLSEHGNPRQETAKKFDDVSQQFIALHHALKKGEQSHAPAEILDGIRDAIRSLENEHGNQIHAGLNALGAATTFANNASEVLTFQNTYRDIVLGESSLSKTLSMAMERFGDKDLGLGLKQLVLALGHDLSAARPSTDTSRLQTLIQDMWQLEVAVTVLDQCKELAMQLSNNGIPLDDRKLMRDIVSISNEKWVNESRFTGLAATNNVKDLPGQITFLSNIRSILKDLPLQVYPDADARQAVLDASQSALDLTIGQEEEL